MDLKDENKKVLIVTYYWPPSGGAGVHRWLKISSFLAENNTCYVYTPSNPDFALKDESLIGKISPKIKVLKKKIFEPYFVYKALLKKGDKKNVNTPSAIGDNKSVIKNMAVWLRGNVFIPDPRVFWVKSSCKYLKKIIDKEGIDVIITTGPPHSMHLIGNKLKKKLGSKINWIADFRDPWTNIDFYDKLKIGKRADRIHRKLEKEVVTSCDTLVVVSESWGNDFLKMGANKVKVITNGFDPSNYNFEYKKNKKFSITHIGSINADRNPTSLWKAISLLSESSEDFKKNIEIKLVGNIHKSVLDSIKEYNLDYCFTLIPYLPHKNALIELSESLLSLLLLNNTKNIDGIIPGKLFEYMGVGNPILAIGKVNGDSGCIIKNNKLGEIVGFDDVENLKKSLLYFFDKYKNNKLKKFTHNDLEEFTIKKLSDSFEEIF